MQKARVGSLGQEDPLEKEMGKHCFKNTVSQRNPNTHKRICSVRKETVLVTQECPTLCDPWTAAHQAPLSMGYSRWEYWSGLPCPPPGDLLNTGIEPRSPALQADSLHLSYQGSPWILKWVVYPFSWGSSQPRNWTRVSCIAAGFFTIWATGEVGMKLLVCKLFFKRGKEKIKRPNFQITSGFLLNSKKILQFLRREEVSFFWGHASC